MSRKNVKNNMVGSLAALCRSYNKDNFAVFFSYSGHIDGVHITVHPGGWKSVVENAVNLKTVYLYESDYYKTISKVKRDLQSCYEANKAGLEMPSDILRDQLMPF